MLQYTIIDCDILLHYKILSHTMIYYKTLQFSGCSKVFKAAKSYWKAPQNEADCPTSFGLGARSLQLNR